VKPFFFLRNIICRYKSESFPILPIVPEEEKNPNLNLIERNSMTCIKYSEVKTKFIPYYLSGS